MLTESIITNTKRYVEIPSASGEEGLLANQIARDLMDIGYSNVERIEPNSLTLLIPGKNRKRLFVINSHIDTVPFKTPPQLRREGDWLVGLGSGDDKVGTAIQMDLAKEYLDNPPPCDILLAFSSKEEVGGDGSVAIAQWLEEQDDSRYEAMGGVILEPTYDESGGFVGFGHRGGEKFTITAKGNREHGGKNLQGEITAITRLSKFLAKLPKIQAKWERKYADEFGVPTINATRLEAGVADNIVPDQATALVDVRSTRKLSNKWGTVQRRLEKKYGITITPKESIENLQVSECPRETLIYQAIRSALPDVSFEVYHYATDQTGWRQYGVNTLMYGPGYIPLMHSDEDRVHVDAIEEVRKNLPKIIMEFAQGEYS